MGLFEQAHKVCVHQNELVMPLLEDFGQNLTYIWPWNEGRSQILNMNILSLHVLLWSIMKYMRFIVTSFLSYRHFKSKINESALVWPWNLGQRSKLKTFFKFLWYDFLYPVNTISCSKTNSKEVIEHWNCDFSYLYSR
jgi:hypothetical protein